MKTFKNYIVEEAVFKEVIVSLLEASITKSSYGPGRQVVPRKKQISSKMKIETGNDPLKKT